MIRPRDNRKVSQSTINAGAKALVDLGQDWKATLPLIKVEGLNKDDALGKIFAQLWLRGYQWMPRKQQWIKRKCPLSRRIKKVIDANGWIGVKCTLCDNPALTVEITVDGRKAQLCQKCWVFNDWL